MLQVSLLVYSVSVGLIGVVWSQMIPISSSPALPSFIEIDLSGSSSLPPAEVSSPASVFGNENAEKAAAQDQNIPNLGSLPNAFQNGNEEGGGGGFFGNIESSGDLPTVASTKGFFGSNGGAQPQPTGSNNLNNQPFNSNNNNGGFFSGGNNNQQQLQTQQPSSNYFGAQNDQQNQGFQNQQFQNPQFQNQQDFLRQQRPGNLNLNPQTIIFGQQGINQGFPVSNAFSAVQLPPIFGKRK